MALNILLNLALLASVAFMIAQVAFVCAKQSQIEIKMAYIRPDHPEQYLCVSHRLPMGNLAEYIVGFKPSGNAKRVHHMLLYGCEMPGHFNRDSPNSTWDCSEMMKNDNSRISFSKGPICQGKTKILYGWAMDAPPLQLPDQVGFKVGGMDTDIHFLVLQVHYAHTHAFVQNPRLADHSGLILDMRRDDDDSGVTKQAGVYLMASNGIVKRGVSEHRISCQITEDVVIHPFRFRVHTHKLGTQVRGYKLLPQKSWMAQQKSVLIGSEDPQKPQMFYKVQDEQMTITAGDSVYASCSFNNTKPHDVSIGQTGDDEMCNFYIMYWTDGNKLLNQNTCITFNPISLFGMTY